MSIELGATANPPGLRRAADRRAARRPRATFTVTYPADYEVQELAGATVDYDVTVKGIRRKELLPLDDDFAKEVSDARDARGAARRASARTCSTAPSTTPTTRCGTICCSELVGAREGGARRARRSGDRSAARGVRPPADGTGRRSDEGRTSTGRSSASGSGRRRPTRCKSTLVARRDRAARVRSTRPTTTSTAEIERFAERVGPDAGGRARAAGKGWRARSHPRRRPARKDDDVADRQGATSSARLTAIGRS